MRGGIGVSVEVASSLGTSFVETSSAVTELESSVTLNIVGTGASVGDSSTELNC